MKVIFTCGGTAGHVNPALALAQYMQERIENLDILFVGTPDGMERGLVEQAGYAFRGVEVGGFCRSLAPSGIRHNLKSVEHLLAAKGRVRAILRDFPADLVVGTGGYASYPITKYAAQHGIPVLAKLPIDTELPRLSDEGEIESYQSDAQSSLADALQAL